MFMMTYLVSMTLHVTQIRSRQNLFLGNSLGLGSMVGNRRIFKIKGAKTNWRVKVLGRREKAADKAKPGDMLFMPPIHP